MKILYITFACILLPVAAHAVPVLQIGAPAGPGDTGVYADYQGSLSNPTEEDTAVTDGSTLYVAGVLGPNTISLGSSTDWDIFDNVNPYGNVGKFDGHGTVLMATFASETDALSSGLTVDGNSSFLGDSDLVFPNNHAPLQTSGAYYLYFDIGEFTNTPNTVPDFDPETGAAAGEIKTLTLALTGGFSSWIHFDVMSIEMTETGPNLRNTIESNPPSHDVTWKGSTNPVPEPTTMLLFGTGLAGLAAVGRRRK